MKFDFVDFYIAVLHSDAVHDIDDTEFMAGSTPCVLAECPYLRLYIKFFLIHLFYLISLLTGPRSYGGSYKITVFCPFDRPAGISSRNRSLFTFSTMVENLNI